MDIINESSQQPYSKTAFDLSKHQGFHPAAFLDKKACRFIFGQIAQQSRLRSLFVKHGSEGMEDLIRRAVKNSKNNGDDWTERPPWWDESESSTDNFDLLVSVLNLGFNNFLSLWN